MNLAVRLIILSPLASLAAMAPAQTLDDAAFKAATESECGKHFYAKRGVAPSGFVKGMAQTHAKTWCDAKTRPDSIGALLSGTGFPAGSDALAVYGRAGGGPGDRLRALFALGLGEGMRESSGNPSAPRDTTARIPPSAETAEAGLFQVSADSVGFSKHLPKLVEQFEADPSQCALDLFSQGTKKSAVPDFGSGKGAAFQHLTRSCPAFATQYALVMLRVKMQHFGPVRRKEAELPEVCVKMFEAVEQGASTDCPWVSSRRRYPVKPQASVETGTRVRGSTRPG